MARVVVIIKHALLPLTCRCVALLAEAGKPRAVCPNPTIKAVEGDTVLLPCHLDPPTSVVNNAIDWKRVDLNQYVYSYRHKQEYHDDQMDQYRNRTTLSHEDLSRGDLTLWISSVQPSDSGPYRCFVSKLMTSCNMSLIVEQQNRTKRDESNTTRPPPDELDNPEQQNRTKREESSTTRPPPDEPDNRGAENMTLVLSITIPVGLLFVVGVPALVKRRKILVLVRRLRGKTKQKAEEENGRELKRLTTPTKDDSAPDDSAADDLGNTEEV